MERQRRKKLDLKAEKLLEEVIEALKEALAEEITLIDIRGKSNIADWFVICQTDTTVHNRACADKVIERLEKKKIQPLNCEGEQDGRWILLDYVDVIVHIMLSELRSFYSLEELWAEKIKKISSE
ncbi:MAG: ribosome silencing factor [Chitinispirillaceae bacterium]|nr:ribosome silencing factor [Chitinispirillaceae bacterium]